MYYKLFVVFGLAFAFAIPACKDKGIAPVAPAESVAPRPAAKASTAGVDIDNYTSMVSSDVTADVSSSSRGKWLTADGIDIEVADNLSIRRIDWYLYNGSGRIQLRRTGTGSFTDHWNIGQARKLFIVSDEKTVAFSPLKTESFWSNWGIDDEAGQSTMNGIGTGDTFKFVIGKPAPAPPPPSTGNPDGDIGDNGDDGDDIGGTPKDDPPSSSGNPMDGYTAIVSSEVTADVSTSSRGRWLTADHIDIEVADNLSIRRVDWYLYNASGRMQLRRTGSGSFTDHWDRGQDKKLFIVAGGDTVSFSPMATSGHWSNWGIDDEAGQSTINGIGTGDTFKFVIGEPVPPPPPSPPPPPQPVFIPEQEEEYVTLPQSGNEVWSATMTVRNPWKSGVFGCANQSGTECDNSDNLSDDDFEFPPGGTTYKITSLYFSHKYGLVIYTDKKLEGDTNRLVLNIGNESFAFRYGGRESDSREWRRSMFPELAGITWKDGQEVNLRITENTDGPTVNPVNGLHATVRWGHVKLRWKGPDDLAKIRTECGYHGDVYYRILMSVRSPDMSYPDPDTLGIEVSGNTRFSDDSAADSLGQTYRYQVETVCEEQTLDEDPFVSTAATVTVDMPQVPEITRFYDIKRSSGNSVKLFLYARFKWTISALPTSTDSVNYFWLHNPGAGGGDGLFFKVERQENGTWTTKSEHNYQRLDYEDSEGKEQEKYRVTPFVIKTDGTEETGTSKGLTL